MRSVPSVRVPGLVAAVVMALVAGLTVSVLSPAGAAPRPPAFPDVIDLPDGFAPEGVAVDRQTAYTGSLLDGRIERIDLKTGRTEEFAPSPGPGKLAVGMDVDERDLLWVAGGGPAFFPGATAGYRVYDTETGALVTDVELPFAAFVNDVVVTRRAAWFTDTFLPVIYRVSIDRDGNIGPTETVALGGDWVQSAGLNGNGIAATQSGNRLVIAQVQAPEGGGAALYTVDADLDAFELNATRVDLDVSLATADGLVLVGRILYVIGGPAGITEIRLTGNLTSGRVTDTLPVPGAVSPTTADLFRGRLYVVDANFPQLGDPTSTHTLTAVRR